MNSLEVHNQVNKNMVSIYRIHRSNDVKTMRHLDMVENHQDVAKQTTIREAIDDLKVGNHVKGTIIDMLA